MSRLDDNSGTRSFLRILANARRHSGWLLLAWVSMVLVAGTTVFTYNLIRPLSDQFLSPAGISTDTSTSSDTGLIGQLDQITQRLQQALRHRFGAGRVALIVLIVLALGIKNCFAFLARFFVALFGLATIRDLRDRLFDTMLGQDPQYFASVSSGSLTSRIINDVQLLNEALAERFGDLLQDSLTVVVLMVYLAQLNARLLLFSLVLAPLMMLPVLYFSRALRRHSRQSLERIGELTGLINETIKGIRIVQGYAMQACKRRRFGSATQRLFQALLKARAIAAANAPVMEVVGACGFALLIAYASAQIAKGTMTVGDLSAFLLAVYGAYNPCKRLNKFNLALQQALVAAHRVCEVLDAPVRLRQSVSARTLDGIGDGVRLVKASFAYDTGPVVLDKLDLCLPAGSTVALVGHSGAGKSTLAQLILRFLEVSGGAVLIGGHDVRSLTLASLRAHIGLVTQETLLFDASVRYNIVAGQDRCNEHRLEAAARAALIHDVITELPQGYDSPVGENGMLLSGGQRQRLAIARALYKDPPLLILDEATSALDAQAERLVQRALENLMAGRTSLVIAHRLSSIRHADHIAVLAHGTIVEQGSHHELMLTNGAYNQMVEHQQTSSPITAEQRS